MYSDPIADLLVRIKNGIQINAKSVSAPHSKVKEEILTLLKREGFIEDCRSRLRGTKKVLEIDLKYTAQGKSVISGLKRVSKPSLRYYASVDQLTPFRSGLGCKVVSTSQGLLTDKGARQENIGGEVIFQVW